MYAQQVRQLQYQSMDMNFRESTTVFDSCPTQRLIYFLVGVLKNYGFTRFELSKLVFVDVHEQSERVPCLQSVKKTKTVTRGIGQVPEGYNH
jgi:hypothetical protein